MKLLSEVHSLNLTFADATPSSAAEIIWLQERMYDDSQNISWSFSSTENETWFVSFHSFAREILRADLRVVFVQSGNTTSSPLLLPNSNLLPLPSSLPTPEPS